MFGLFSNKPVSINMKQLLVQFSSDEMKEEETVKLFLTSMSSEQQLLQKERIAEENSIAEIKEIIAELQNKIIKFEQLKEYEVKINILFTNFNDRVHFYTSYIQITNESIKNVVNTIKYREDEIVESKQVLSNISDIVDERVRYQLVRIETELLKLLIDDKKRFEDAKKLIEKKKVYLQKEEKILSNIKELLLSLDKQIKLGKNNEAIEIIKKLIIEEQNLAHLFEEYIEINNEVLQFNVETEKVKIRFHELDREFVEIYEKNLPNEDISTN